MSVRALLAAFAVTLTTMAMERIAPQSQSQPEPAAPRADAPPAPAPTTPPAESPAEAAERARNDLTRARADLERRLKVIDEAQAMLDRGETPAAVRDFLKSKNMGVMARMFEDNRRGAGPGPAGPGGLGVRPRGAGGGMRRGAPDRDGPGEPPRDPRDPRDPQGGPPPPPPLITVDDRQVILDVVRQLMPQRFAELERLKDTDPPAAERQLMQLMESPRIRSLLELRRSNPEAFRSRVEEFKAAADGARHARAIVELESKGAPAAQIDAEQALLRAAAARQFDKRIEGLSQEVERLADRAASLRSELDDQNARRSELIDRAINDAIDRAKHGPPRPPREGDRPRPGPGGPGDSQRPR